jgi:hypothetical protein
VELGDPPFAGSLGLYRPVRSKKRRGNGVHSRQETRIPFRKIDKEDVVGRVEEGAGVSKIVTLICRDLPTMAETTQTPSPLLLLSSHRIYRNPPSSHHAVLHRASSTLTGAGIRWQFVLRKPTQVVGEEKEGTTLPRLGKRGNEFRIEPHGKYVQS